MSFKKINSLKNFYEELDSLCEGIYKFCRLCKDEDCKGYIWLLPEEAKELIEEGVPIVEINRKLCFLDSFIREQGKIDTEKVKPVCPFREEDKMCLIYSLRPLACRLYPLDFKISEGEIYIILHVDCLFVRTLLQTRDFSQFLEKVFNLFHNCDRSLLRRILRHYQAVNSILKYPKDYNYEDCIELFKVVDLKKGKLILCQNVKQFLTQRK